MTSALIIILREVLEAMLIISLLLAATVNLGIHRKWIAFALAAGLLGTGIYAYFFDYITESFEGVGQEVANAASQFTTSICLAIFSLFIVMHINSYNKKPASWVGLIALVGSIGLAIAREGAEISIYVSGFLLSPEPLQPVLLGGAIGAGIGLSAGALFYYALANLKRRQCLVTSSLILVPVAAGMVSQGVNYLMQADIVPSQFPVWDSSAVIPEGSVAGELLYALFSYEATPTPLQLVLYLLTATVTIVGMIWVTRPNKSNDANSVSHA